MEDTSDIGAADADSKKYSWRAWIVAHWRGELSLGDAFWSNGVVLTFVFGFIVWGLNHLPDDNSTWLWNLMNVALAAFFFAMTFWQVVGIWRSARHFPGRRLDDGRHVGRHLWPFAARLTVLRWGWKILGVFGLFVYMLIDWFIDTFM